MGDHHGGGHGGGAIAALCHQNGQIPAAGLGDGVAALAQIVNLLGGQARLQAAADDGDGGGDGAVFADDLLHVQSSLHILGIGHAVGDDGALQSHHGTALGHCLLHLRCDIQITIHKSFTSC